MPSYKLNDQAFFVIDLTSYRGGIVPFDLQYSNQTITTCEEMPGSVETGQPIEQPGSLDSSLPARCVCGGRAP